MTLIPKRRTAENATAPAPPPREEGPPENPQPTGEDKVDIIGIDIGFGFTKAAKANETVLFKSILGEATEIQYTEDILGQEPTEDHLHVEIDGVSHFIGELAERQSNTRFFTLDQGQFVSQFARPLAMTALARLASSHIPINLVTGLPIGHYRQHKDAFANLLLGNHTVTLLDRDGTRQERTIKVNKARVVPQPFGSLFNLMLSDTGQVTDRRLLREKIGVIDIGFRTSDYTISDKMRYSERGSRTTESGIARAFNIIATKLREKSGINVELYRLYDAVAQGSIKIRGEKIDISKLVEQVFGQLATAVANEVDRLWADDWDMDAIAITGGGGAVLAPYLKPLLTGEILSAEQTEDARFNNVNGYWKYGRYQWKDIAS